MCASSTERARNTEVANDAVPGYVSQMALLSLPDAVLIHIAEQLVDTNLRDCVRLSSITSKALCRSLEPALRLARSRRLFWVKELTHGHKISDDGGLLTMVGVPHSDHLWAAGLLLPASGIWRWSLDHHNCAALAIGICNADCTSAWGVHNMSKSKQWDSFRWLRDGNNSIAVRPLAKGPLVEPIRVTRIDLEFNTETGILKIDLQPNLNLPIGCSSHERLRHGPSSCDSEVFVMNAPVGVRMRPWVRMCKRRGDMISVSSRWDLRMRDRHRRPR